MLNAAPGRGSLCIYEEYTATVARPKNRLSGPSLGPTVSVLARWREQVISKSSKTMPWVVSLCKGSQR